MFSEKSNKIDGIVLRTNKIFFFKQNEKINLGGKYILFYPSFMFRWDSLSISSMFRWDSLSIPSMLRWDSLSISSI